MHAAGIKRFYELGELTTTKLLSIRGCGRTTAREIARKVSQVYGIVIH